MTSHLPDPSAFSDMTALRNTMEGLSLRRARHVATGLLREAGMDGPRLDAEVLLSHVLGCDRTRLYVRDHELLSPASALAFAELLVRRMAHEPVAYLVGERDFYDVSLSVNPHVLIPRPETEHLLEQALAWARAQGERRLCIVDVGTGSGALAIVLARHLPLATVVAIDVSEEALAVAGSNVVRYGLSDRISLVRGDLLSPLEGTEIDLIVANLPYIPGGEMPHLMSDVRDYEPHLALDGGPGGLTLIERLLPQAAALLAMPGLLLLEIDPSQAEVLSRRASAQFPGARVAVGQDYAQWPRWVRVERFL